MHPSQRDGFSQPLCSRADGFGFARPGLTDMSEWQRSGPRDSQIASYFTSLHMNVTREHARIRFSICWNLHPRTTDAGCYLSLRAAETSLGRRGASLPSSHAYALSSSLGMLRIHGNVSNPSIEDLELQIRVAVTYKWRGVFTPCFVDGTRPRHVVRQ